MGRSLNGPGVVNRGDVWLAEVGNKVRPVLVLTRNEVIDVRLFVTVAEITSSIRGIGPEVPFDWRAVGLDEASVVNCDGLHTVRQSSLTRRVGAVDAETMRAVCSATTFAIGC